MMRSTINKKSSGAFASALDRFRLRSQLNMEEFCFDDQEGVMAEKIWKTQIVCDHSRENPQLHRQFKAFKEGNYTEPCPVAMPNLRALFTAVCNEAGIEGINQREYFINRYNPFHLQNSVYLAPNGSRNGINKKGQSDTTDCSTSGHIFNKVYTGCSSNRSLRTSNLIRDAAVQITAIALDLYDANSIYIPEGNTDFADFKDDIIMRGIVLANGARDYTEYSYMNIQAASFKAYANTSIPMFDISKIVIKDEWPTNTKLFAFGLNVLREAIDRFSAMTNRIPFIGLAPKFRLVTKSGVAHGDGTPIRMCPVYNMIDSAVLEHILKFISAIRKGKNILQVIVPKNPLEQLLLLAGLL